MAPEDIEKRNKAVFLAQEIMDKATKAGRKILNIEVLAVLRQWAFRENTARKIVMRDGVKWVYSDSLGLIRFQNGEFSLSDASAEWPAVTKIVREMAP